MLTLPLPVPLKNSVALVRAGESIRDAQGVVETQPVKKLSTSNALTALGREQAVAAAHELERLNMIPTFIFTSNTERAYETATIIARELRLGQNRVVPEFSFLDARGLGSDLEGTNYEEALNKVHAADLQLGINYKGGGNSEDLGSVSDSVSDVLVRARQLLSGFESLYSGEQVLVVSPDSEILSILTAALTSPDPDESLPTHYKFSFKNGEVRLLEPLVVPPTTLVTGQTQEEADENNRVFRALRVRGSMPATSEADTGAPTWWSLYDAALDAVVTSASSQ
jgi:broad specificity phosphatase PhoE